MVGRAVTASSWFSAVFFSPQTALVLDFTCFFFLSKNSFKKFFYILLVDIFILLLFENHVVQAVSELLDSRRPSISAFCVSGDHSQLLNFIYYYLCYYGVWVTGMIPVAQAACGGQETWK